MSGFINTADFETFLQLDDLKGNFAGDLEQLQASKQPEIEIDDEFPEQSDVVDGDEDFNIDRFKNKDGGVTFEDEEGWVEEEDEGGEEGEAEGDEDDGASKDEVEVDESSQEQDDGQVEYEDGDAYDVDYETVITLPDGRELTIEELAGGYQEGTAVAQRETQLQTHIAAFEERVSGLKNVLDLAQLEADRVLQDYDGFDWEKLALEDPQAYVENSRFLERYKQRKAELVAAQQRIYDENAAKEQELYQAKCSECVNILKGAIPNWDENLYQSLMQYAVDLGATEEDILKENRPSVFLALHKAYQFDKGKQQVMAKIKRPGAPKKVVKAAGAKTTSSQKPDDAKVAKAFSEGRITNEQAFKYLVD